MQSGFSLYLKCNSILKTGLLVLALLLFKGLALNSQTKSLIGENYSQISAITCDHESLAYVRCFCYTLIKLSML